MKLVHGILLGCLSVSSVYADEYNFDVTGGVIVLSNDSAIARGVNFVPESVKVTESIRIDNYGVIKSDLYLCDGCLLHMKNAGVFVGDVHFGVNSKLIQVINNTGDMNEISGVSNFNVLVENADVLSLDTIVNFAERADKIILKNSVLKIDSPVNFNKDIELHGEIDLIADDLSRFYDVPILTNISGDGSVRVVNNNPDILYADMAFVDNGALYVRRVRETDYVKIFKDDTGKFLNALRYTNPNDSLITELDRASDMHSFRSVMNKSVRFNPEILVRPLNVLHMFDRLETNASENAFDFRPFVIWTDDFSLYGVNVGLRGHILTGLDVWGGLRVGVLDYDSDLDTFSGRTLGANLGAKYTMKNNLFVRANLGADVMDVDVGNVLYENVIYMNPRSASGVLSIDIGYIYNLENDIYVEPFVGVKSDWWCVENVSEFNADIIAGIGAGYAFSMLGLRYDYSVRGVVMTDGEVGVSGRVGFWSEFDAFGGDVQISAVQMDDIMNYKVALNARMWF
ncbi:MAG: autotransporter outer membrane beta-barrel domain-containing protein [Alphaproteobacteria bacterium]|nr:autotransporter outer membrane beta-barrel domain-containing protein [Alphaproteobacteria bacterium]